MLSVGDQQAVTLGVSLQRKAVRKSAGREGLHVTTVEVNNRDGAGLLQRHGYPPVRQPQQFVRTARHRDASGSIRSSGIEDDERAASQVGDEQALAVCCLRRGRECGQRDEGNRQNDREH